MVNLSIQAIKVARPIHWIKNLALFCALFLTGNLLNQELFLIVFYGFISFSMATSATYIFNDIFDKQADSQHPIKKGRPIASGKLPIFVAIFEAVILATASLFIAYLLNDLFFTVVLVYLSVQIIYSLGMKNVAVVDILLIATGFVLRVYGGSFLIDAHLSVWFLLCVVSASLFLAAGKRRSEINMVEEVFSKTRQSLNKYSKELLNSYVTMFGNATWMSWSLYSYFESPRASEDFWLILAELSRTTTINKLMMLTVPIVIFGIMRYVSLIFEGKSEAPEKILLTDKALIISVALWLLVVYLIVYSGISVPRI